MQITASQITLAIITKNRLFNLDRLLKSIYQLSVLPGAILIIDNDRQQTAQKKCQIWSQKLPLKYLSCHQIGASYARNFALQHCQTRFLCFVDDDCVLDKYWFENLLSFSQVFLKNKNVAYVQGQSNLLNKDNVWARVQFRRYHRWFYHHLDPDHLDPLLLDTKNICFDLKKIKKLRFDKKYSKFGFSGSEDTDFGLQIAELKFIGVYCSQMKLDHQETHRLFITLRKVFNKGRLSFILQNKWGFCDLFQRDVYQAKNKLELLKLFFKSMNWRSLNDFDQILTFFFQAGVWYQKEK